MDQKEKPIISMSKEEREEVWDDAYVKEEGVIIEFDLNSKTGRVRSLQDGDVYSIDSRVLVRTGMDLKNGDKVLFAPIEDSGGNDYARVVRIIELGT